VDSIHPVYPDSARLLIINTRMVPQELQLRGQRRGYDGTRKMKITLTPKSEQWNKFKRLGGACVGNK